MRNANFEDTRRYTADNGKIGNIPDDHGIGTYDYIVSHSNAPQDLRASTELDSAADRGGAQWILGAAVADGHTVADQTVIANHRRAMDDDAAVMLNAQTAPDSCGRADDNAAKNFRELVEYEVGDRPRCPHYFIADDEAGMSETVHQQRPEADSQQSLPLRLQVFQNYHRGIGRKVGLTEYANCDTESAGGSYAILSTTATAWRPYDNKVRRPPGDLGSPRLS